MRSRLRSLFGRKAAQSDSPPEASPQVAVWKTPDPGLTESLTALIEPALMAAIRHQQVVSIAQPIGPGLWTVPFFTEAGCDRLSAVIDHRLLWQRTHPQAPPNSMHSSGVVFEPMGLAPAMSHLRSSVIDPIRAVLYPEFEALDDDYAFAATYGHQLDRRLGFHVDDSEVTLNVSLSADYSGGEVIFQGRRCTLHRQEAHRPDEEIVLNIPRGHGLLHAGSHRHLVSTVSGERRNLIIWCRSGQTRTESDQATCPEWCGHIPRS